MAQNLRSIVAPWVADCRQYLELRSLAATALSCACLLGNPGSASAGIEYEVPPTAQRYVLHGLQTAGNDGATILVTNPSSFEMLIAFVARDSEGTTIGSIDCPPSVPASSRVQCAIPSFSDWPLDSLVFETSRAASILLLDGSNEFLRAAQDFRRKVEIHDAMTAIPDGIVWVEPNDRLLSEVTAIARNARGERIAERNVPMQRGRTISRWDIASFLTGVEIADVASLTLKSAVPIAAGILPAGTRQGAHLSTASGFTVAWPLDSGSPYSSNLSSIFDHSMKLKTGTSQTRKFCADTVATWPPGCSGGQCFAASILAYTGESGGVNAAYFESDSTSSTCSGAAVQLRSFKRVDGANYQAARRSEISYDGHPGIDIPVPSGTPVKAAAAGTVVSDGTKGGTKVGCSAPCEWDPNGGGCFVRIKHLTHQTQYLHLSKCFVDVHSADITIDAGQVIAESGNTGSASDGAHLHFEVKRNIAGAWVSVDPYGWTGPGLDPYPHPNENLWGSTGAPAPPTLVSATDSSFSDKVRVTWAPSAGATGYKIYRNTTPKPSGSILVGNAAVPPFDDTSATSGVAYTYWVKATGNTGTSNYSIGDAGLRGGTGGTKPTATTNAASAVGATTATLNATVNPNGLGTTAYFQWGTTASFGNVTTIKSIGSGTSPSATSAPLSSLAANTTYYFRVVATNSAGSTPGNTRTFTTTGPNPTVTSVAASLVTSGSARINGTANANGLAANAYFQWGTTTALGSTSGMLPISGTLTTSFYLNLVSLVSNTTYYFRAVVVSSAGTTYGSILSFTTASPKPTVTTYSATDVSGTSGRMNGNAIPNGLATSVYFQWGTTTALGSKSGELAIGTTTTNFYLVLTNLSVSTTYYYRAVGMNSAGTTYGAILSFSTGAKPSTSTLAPSSLTAFSARLHGSAIANGLSTNVYFQWGLTASLGSTSATSNIGSGYSNTFFYLNLINLSPNTTYYFRAAAVNSAGTTYGSITSFTTPLATPTVVTTAATMVTSTTARLTGYTNANGLATNVFFQWGTSQFLGSASGTLAIGNGTSNYYYKLDLGSLTPSTTYYFRAGSTSSAGTSYGSILSFRTGS
jgi:murein DD-endopeptidase MepM/ murein hydrolase activator NlpD